MAIDVAQELELCAMEKAERAPMDSWWQTIMEVCVPRNAYLTRQGAPVPAQDYARIYDTTVIESAEGLANMMNARLTPAGQQWMVWLPPFEFMDDEQVMEWYAECSHRAMHLINQSNFATKISEVNTDRATVGTSLLLCYETGNKRAPFRFRHAPIGTYTFQEDLDGRANILRREAKMSAYQMQLEFPNGSFGEKVQNALKDPKKKYKADFTVWHIVKPRLERDPSKIDNKNMPYEEFYLCEEDKNLIEETGQHEFVGNVSRFQLGADGSKWGVSPARKAMPAVAQANYLQEQLDILLDVQINPRILAEAGMVGEIDMRPGQKTLTRAGALANQGGGVREWLTGGNYPMGKDRIADKQNQIKKLFYHGMWADLARVDKEMTAEEVRAIRDQSEMLFVGVNARFEADLNPMLSTRIFGICLRAGIFPDPPPQLVQAGKGEFYEIPDPQTSYQSDLSRVLQRKAVENSDSFLQRLAAMAQFEPSVLDEFDLAIHARELARAYNFKSPFLRTEQDVKAILEKKVQAQQQAQAQQQMVAGAEMVGKLPPQMQQQLSQQ